MATHPAIAPGRGSVGRDPGSASSSARAHRRRPGSPAGSRWVDRPFRLTSWPYRTGDGIVIIGRGLARRREVSLEVAAEARNAGLARRLALSARALVPLDEPLWAQVAPANAASVRAILAAGYRPIGAESSFSGVPTAGVVKVYAWTSALASAALRGQPPTAGPQPAALPVAGSAAALLHDGCVVVAGGMAPRPSDPRRREPRGHAQHASFQDVALGIPPVTAGQVRHRRIDCLSAMASPPRWRAPPAQSRAGGALGRMRTGARSGRRGDRGSWAPILAPMFTTVRADASTSAMRLSI